MTHGAALPYNLLLAEALADADRTSGYRVDLQTWAEVIRTRTDQHRTWARDDLWALVASSQARVSLRTHAFIDTWVDLALSTPPGAVADSAAAREMVRRREELVKRGRARLVAG